MKKSQLKQLIKEIVAQTNELLGDEPKIGQSKWTYEVDTTVSVPGLEPYDRVDSSGSHVVLAKDEIEAKKQAISAYNLKVVKIKSVKVTKVGDVTQADLDKYKKAGEYYSHALRPKNQGGWGAD